MTDGPTTGEPAADDLLAAVAPTAAQEPPFRVTATDPHRTGVAAGDDGDRAGDPSRPRSPVGARPADIHVVPSEPTAGHQRTDRHLCLVHADADELRVATIEYLTAGLEEGLRVAYTGPGEPVELRDRVRGLQGSAALEARGALHLLPHEAVYGTAPVSAEEVIERYADLTEQALVDGYRGLRVVADVTDLGRRPEDHDAFARYELALGPVVASVPFSALCAYGEDLGPDPLAEVACVHPAGSARAPFRLTAVDPGHARLDGEVDVTGRRAFVRTVARLDQVVDGDPLVLDLSGTTFIDHRALMVLDASAAAGGRRFVLDGAPAIVAELVDLLQLRSLQVGTRRPTAGVHRPTSGPAPRPTRSRRR